MKDSSAIAIDVDPIAFLIGEDSTKFLAKTWEQKPALFKASTDRKQFCKGLFGMEQLLSEADKREEAGKPMLFETDVNAARYVDGRRESPNGDVATADDIKELFDKEGCTMQVHQPQRFTDPLWRLCAAMEAQLGCLVGCNAYLTPPKTQGLAPHYDDAEIFVLQTEGTKKWKIYTPTEGPLGNCRLANRPSGDLPEDLLDKPAMEVTLQVGDVLYLPRGTIHQACAGDKNYSSHLTFSTYQRWSWADLAQHAISVALADPRLQPSLPASSKSGLPPGFLYQTELSGSGLNPHATSSTKPTGDEPAKGIAIQLAKVLRDIAGALEAGASDDDDWCIDVIGGAADVMSEDFMRNRLPPHPKQLVSTNPNPQAPTLEDTIVCVADRKAFRLVPMEPEGGEKGGCGDGECCDPGCADHEHEHDDSDDDEEEEEGQAVRLMTCLNNDRETHMLALDGESDSEDERESDDEEGKEDEERSEGEEDEESDSESDSDDEEDLVFPVDVVLALNEILSSKGKGIKVKDLDIPDPDMAKQLVAFLLVAGIVTTVEDKAAGATKGGEKKRKGGKQDAGKAANGKSKAAKKSKK